MQSEGEKPSEKIRNIYMDDTIETIRFEKDALEVKFKHNINELASKNAIMSSLLLNSIVEERDNLMEECDIFKKMVDTCISLQDSLTNLDALEKKTEILKAQIFQIRDSYEQQNQTI
jgi:hypothetical protein